MKIECPKCRRQYQIPEKLVGQTIRCLKCGEPIASIDQATTTMTSGVPRRDGSDPNDSPSALPDPLASTTASTSRPSVQRWQAQKESAAPPIIKPEIAQKIVVVICLLALGAVLLVVAEWQWGAVTGRGRNSDPSLVGDNEGAGSGESERLTGEVPRDGQETGKAAAGPDAGDAATRGKERSRPLASAKRTNVADQAGDDSKPGEEEESREEPIPRAEDYPDPILGVIPLFDPTWDTNQPLYSLRMLDQPELTGEVMEKIVRMYGAPPFIRRYRDLLNSDDYTVQFYAAVGLANFGEAVVPSIRTMLKAIANSRSRPGYQLRLDLANQLIAHWRRDASPALFDLVRDTDIDVKGAAIEYLALFGWESKPAVPAIAASVTDARPYVPMQDDLKTLSIGQLAREALRRLGAQAVDALPILERKIHEMEPSPDRDELVGLAVEIGRAANLRPAQALPLWAKEAGLQYLPDTLPQVVVCRPKSLLEAGMIDDHPDWLESLRARIGIGVDELEQVTLAYQNDGRSLWEKRPFLGVLRTVDSVDSIELPPARRVDVEGQVVHLIPGDLAYQRIGAHTLVFGTADDVLAVAAKRIRRRGPPPIVIPRDDATPLYFRATPAWGVSVYEGTERPEVSVEFEFGSPGLARVAVELLRGSKGREAEGERLPGPWATLSRDASSPWQLAETRGAMRIRLPDADSGRALVDLKMWEDAKGEGVQRWEDFAWKVRTQRSPFSNAAGLIRPELRQVSDFYRNEVMDIVDRFMNQLGIDATASLDLSGSQKKNVIRFLNTVGDWADSRQLPRLTHFIDAIHLDPVRAVGIYSRVVHRDSIECMAERVEGEETLQLSSDTRQRLKRMFQHYLNIGDQPTVVSILKICSADPWLATQLEDRIGDLQNDSELSEATRKLAGEVRRMRQPFDLPVQDYSRLEKYARASGTANVGLELEQPFRRPPPGIQKMLAFAHQGRTFDVDLPHVDPELIRNEYDGPANAEDERYTRVDTLRYMIKEGDVVVASRRNYPSEHLARDWAGTSAYLGDALVRDIEGGDRYEFDRRRDYVLNGVPKSQRIIQVGEWIFEVRWIGRNYSRFPSQVDKIISSLVPRMEFLAAEEKKKQDVVTGPKTAKDPKGRNLPTARLGSGK